MDELRPNSHKSRENPAEPPVNKKVEKVISGSAKTKKRNEVRKFADVFIQEDVSNVKSYISQEVFIPALKKMISEIVSNGIDMFLYGETGRSRKSSGGASRVSYRSFYDKHEDRGRRLDSVRGSYEFDDVIVDTKGDAEEVLLRLDELIDMYGQASVADVYDLVGLVGNYTDNRYGWTNIGNASSVRMRDGRYLLRFPRAVPLQIN